MNERFRDALARGQSQIAKFAGESVNYKRGASSITLTGTRGDKSDPDALVGETATIKGTRVDWIFERSEIVEQASGEISPILADRIVDSDGVIYELVKHPADGKVSRWMPHRVALRVHTIVIEGE